MLHHRENQGGPEKNERSQVPDAFGNPIPHLYESDEPGCRLPEEGKRQSRPAALPAFICAEDAADTDYANRLFDPARVHTMELRMAEEDWADLSRPLQDRPQQFLRRSHLHEEFYKL